MRVLFYFITLIFTASLSSSEKDFETAYAEIQPALEKFTRPFTLFIFNAENPLFSLLIAKQFPLATCVVADRSGAVFEGEQSDSSNIIILGKPLTINDLKNLLQTEHFDVMVAFNTDSIKNFNWIARNLADQSIIYSTSANSPLVLEGSGKPFLKPHWYLGEKPSVELHLSKKGQSLLVRAPKATWPCKVQRPVGISLVTFLALQGSWPEKSLLRSWISEIEWKYYSNLAPWDIFVINNGLEHLPFSPFPTVAKNPKELTINLLELSASELKSTLGK